MVSSKRGNYASCCFRAISTQTISRDASSAVESTEAVLLRKALFSIIPNTTQLFVIVRT